MSKLEQISHPIEVLQSEYDSYLRGALGSDGAMATAMLDYILSGRGKGIRPTLTMLTASLEPQSIDHSRLYVAAMMVEMIHTASLVHDDVVDGASIRRSRPSVNAMWDSRSAVLIGDYILSRTLVTGMESGAYDIVTYVTKTIDLICQGELLQSENCGLGTMSLELYLKIVHHKTATLISAACVVGAMARNASPQEIATIKEFGDKLGIAFQIKDDILDYTGSGGDKEQLIDLAEGKVTLPLIAALKVATPEQRELIYKRISRHQADDIEHIARFVLQNRGIESAYDQMHQYITMATDTIAHYPAGEVKDSLLALCTFVAERDR